MLNEELVEYIRSIASTEVFSGVVLAEPTGQVFEDDSTFIEVLIGTKSFYAKTCSGFGVHNIPSKKWLEKHKDHFRAWVAFENGNPAHPILLGMVPLNGYSEYDNPTKVKSFETEKFKFTVDDTSGSFTVETLGGKPSEFIVRGESLKEFLGKLLTVLEGLTTVKGDAINPASITQLKLVGKLLDTILSDSVKIP